MTIEEETSTTPTTTSTYVSGMATSMVQSFKPITNICQNLCGIHGYADDPSRQVTADHFCAHLSEDFRQCLIYDKYDDKMARLIGVEYIISRKMFEELPDEEKRYWHSHVGEVKLGVLVMPRVPNVMEHKEMEKLVNTYGKTWHLWQVDRGDPLPYGEAKLMCSFTEANQVNAMLLAKRDAALGINTAEVAKAREDIQFLPPHPLADQFLKQHSQK